MFVKSKHPKDCLLFGIVQTKTIRSEIQNMCSSKLQWAVVEVRRGNAVTHACFLTTTRSQKKKNCGFQVENPRHTKHSFSWLRRSNFGVQAIPLRPFLNVVSRTSKFHQKFQRGRRNMCARVSAVKGHLPRDLQSVSRAIPLVETQLTSEVADASCQHSVISDYTPCAKSSLTPRIEGHQISTLPPISGTLNKEKHMNF